MIKRSIKDITFLDRFIKNWTCSAKNHPDCCYVNLNYP